MDIASLLSPEKGGDIGAPLQASQVSTTPMNSVPTRSNQWLRNTNSTVLKSADESDAFLENIGSVDKLIAQSSSNMDKVMLNSSRDGSQNKTHNDKILPSLSDKNSLAARSSKQSSNLVFDLGLDIYYKMDKMKDIRKITRLWIKEVPGARLYSARLGFWKEKCDSWWFFLSEHSTEKFKLETWTEARIQNVFMILGKDRELIR
ncbi:hypothetical protein BCON_0084g00050 [Botryotinia convoluta]|uniref:Uncharacterized protein n=1 Tax=Botryotinia convoluta TaxID=54673 RepID=A0A4Z1IH22_9HELO|nr:hypothetical protein BCON_0084g00050 [Botryotinia convoluta]